MAIPTKTPFHIVTCLSGVPSYDIFDGASKNVAICNLYGKTMKTRKGSVTRQTTTYSEEDRSQKAGRQKSCTQGILQKASVMF